MTLTKNAVVKTTKPSKEFIEKLSRSSRMFCTYYPMKGWILKASRWNALVYLPNKLNWGKNPVTLVPREQLQLSHGRYRSHPERSRTHG